MTLEKSKNLVSKIKTYFRIKMHLPLSDKIELNILHQNSHQAEKNKIKFNDFNLLCLNVMSSPGAVSYTHLTLPTMQVV